MPRTKDDVKYRDKIGKTLYVARPYQPMTDGVEWTHNEYAPSRTFPNLGLAKAWLAKELPKLGVHWVGEIEPGQFVDCSFDDEGYGRVSDVAWEPDWNRMVYVYQREYGKVEFDG